MKKVVRIGAIVLLSLLAASPAAYAVIKYTEKITNTATIQGYELKLWRVDTNAAVTAINWGQLETGTNKTSWLVVTAQSRHIFPILSV